MFVNGQGLRGNEFSDSLADAKFLGEIATAAKYRFYAFGQTFPGLERVPDNGWSIPGELYELPYLRLANDLLPREPDDLELGIIELEDGSGSLAMLVREASLRRPSVVDISDRGGWRAYLDDVASQTGPQV